MGDHHMNQGLRLITGYKLPRGEIRISLRTDEPVVISIVNEVIILLIIFHLLLHHLFFIR